LRTPTARDRALSARPPALAAALLLAGILAGCGNDHSNVASPTAPALTVPGETAPKIKDRTHTETTDTSAESSAPSGGTPALPSAGSQQQTQQSQQTQQTQQQNRTRSGGGGGAAEPTPQGGASPPSGGSPRYQQFCKDNPGAC
jgi:hypothetical protein